MTVADALSALLPSDALASEAFTGERAAPALGRPPEAVVRPASSEEVATLLSWASREGVGVLPMGGGRRVAPVAREGRYVAVATDRLAGIEQYEPADMTVTAGAGTSFATIDRELRAHGQWAPFDPPHVTERSLGGLASSGESGPLWMGYGDLRHHVLGMTVVTGDGRELDLGGRVVKNVAGFDLLKAVIGSRGTLAVITSVCLRAFPRPPVDRVVALTDGSVAGLLPYALKVGTAPVMPVSSMMVDRFDAAGGGPALVVRLHGALATVDADQARLEEHVGRSFETLGDAGMEAAAPTDDVAAALDALRDHASDHEVVLAASARPSRLGELLEALEPLEPEALAVDTYAARVRAGVGSVDHGLLSEARSAIERVDGAFRLARGGASRGGERAGASTPSGREAALTGRLVRAFDPEGVLWPARD